MLRAMWTQVRRLLSVALFSCAFLLPQGLPARATSFMAQPFPKTVQESPTIVRGKVRSSHSDWGRSSDDSRQIFTYTDLDVEEVIKGPGIQAPSIQIREIGGEVGGVGMEVAGSSHFSPGEDIVVMLGNKNDDGSFDVRGLMMGKLDVRKDRSGQEILSGPAIDYQGEEASGAGGDTLSQKIWTLEALRRLVAGQGPEALQSPRTRKESKFKAVLPRVAPQAALRLQPSSQEQPVQPAPESPKGAGTSPWSWGLALLGLGGVGTWWIARSRT